MTDDLSMGDFRRVSVMPLWRALKNPSSASEWLSECMGIEPFHIHVTITKSETVDGKITSILGGRIRTDGPLAEEAVQKAKTRCKTFETEPLNDSSIRFSCTVEHDAPKT